MIRNEKRKRTRIISLLISLCMVVTMLPATAFAETEAAAAGSVVYTDDTYSGVEDGTSAKPYARFEDAVANVADGGTIYIKSGGAFLNTQEITGSGNGQPPFVINKSVTVKPADGLGTASLDVRAAGILLGGDVTFENIQLDFGNGYHDAIFANGHSLTLKNVSRTSGARDIDLFAGGLYSNDVLSVTPVSGTDAVITIETNTGSSDFGNIYAGGMNTSYLGSTEINIIADNANRLSFGTQTPDGDYPGAVYSCGALEAYINPDDFLNVEAEPAPPAANAESFPVSGNVTINFDGDYVANVYGDTGSSGASTLKVSAVSGSSVTTWGDNISLYDVDSVEVCEGTFKINPSTAGTTFSSLAVNHDEITGKALLDLSGSDNWSTGDFHGGGILMLPETGKLNITGALTGTTAFRVSGPNSSGEDKTESAWAEPNHGYIVSDTAGTQQSFTFNSHDYSQPDYNIGMYQEDGKKVWKVSESEELYVPVVDGFKINEAELSEEYTKFNTDGTGCSITVQLPESEDAGRINEIPFAYTIKDLTDNNVYEAEYKKDAYGYYGKVSALDLCMGVVEGETSGTCSFNLWSDYDTEKKVNTGSYEITVSYVTATGQKTQTVILNIEEDKIEDGREPGIVSFDSLVGVPETLDAYYSRPEDFINMLPNETTAYFDTGKREVLAVQWSCNEYNAAPGASNIFTWTVDTGQYALAEGVSASGTVTIKNKAATDISQYKDSVVLSTSAYTYNGEEKTPDVTIAGLTKGTDFTVAYSNNTNAGTATVEITGKGNYVGTITETFTINKAKLTATKATASGKAYDGGKQVKVTKVYFSGAAEGDAVSVSVSNLKGTLSSANAGTYSKITLPALTLTGADKGNYTIATGTVPLTTAVNITKAAISSKTATMSISTSAYTYNGSAKKPTVTVKYGSKTLKSGTDYTVSYKNNVYPGTATATITGKNNYSGSLSKNFTIKVPDLAATKSVSVNLSGGHDDLRAAWSKVSGATGYYVYYKKSTAKSYTLLGTTTSTAYKKANLADGAAYSFRIYPYVKINGKVYKDSSYRTSSNVYTLKKVSTPKVSKKSKKYIKVSWTNIPGESGYQIARSTKKTKGYKVIKTASYKYKTVNIKTTRNKTYYYKIRAYKTVGGKKIYGPWSSPRKYKLR